MSWRVLYVEESEHLSLYLDNIKIIKDGEDLLIPISDVHTLILDNYKINLSVHLLNALTQGNVNVVLCGVNHLPQSIVFPNSGHHLSTIMLKKQLAWSDQEKQFIQKHIVTNKIRMQYKLLIHRKVSQQIYEKLIQYSNEVTPGDSTNREGLASKMYFRALFGESFKRFDDDVLNAGLNYGYSILRSQISKVIVSKGLNTSLGFFHKGPANDFNLSDDIIEPFRPIIDHWVASNLLDEKIFLREHRIGLIKATTNNIIFQKQSQSIFNTMNLFVESILSFIETGDQGIMDQVDINFYEL